MAYNQNNLSKINNSMFSGAWNLWLYQSADSFATVKAAGYISNGGAGGVLGGGMKMEVRDLVIVSDTATPATTLASVVAISAAGAVTLSTTGVVVAE